MRKMPIDGQEIEPDLTPARGRYERSIGGQFERFSPHDLSQAQALIDSIAPVTIGNLRDRAILAVFAFAKASPNEVTGIRFKDYFSRGDEQYLRLMENGRERIQIVQGKLKEQIDAYIIAANVTSEAETPLFRTLDNSRPQRLHPRAVDLGTIEKALKRHLLRLYHSHGINQNLIDSIRPKDRIALRDRAMIATILYTSASPEMIAQMRMRDYYTAESRYYIKFYRRAPCLVPPQLVQLMGDYLAVTKGATRGLAPLFRGSSGRAIQAGEILDAISRRHAAADRCRRNQVELDPEQERDPISEAQG